MRTKVAIIGAGPSGLLLSQILDLNGIDSIVVERQSRAYVKARIRAGVLEAGLTDLLRAAEVGERMDREGEIHEGFSVSINGAEQRVDLSDLTGGKTVMVYGQTEIQHDLFDARDARNGVILDEAEDVTPHDIDTDAPYLTFRRHGEDQRIDCDFICGCDGYHGVARTVFPDSLIRAYEMVYPVGWLGVLSRTQPVSEELIYSQHDRGFALCSRRSKTLSRYYIQVPLSDKPEDWSDERFWDELKSRMPTDAAARMETGPSIEKSIAPLRSFVCEPLSHGRVFLAGDAGHIVPPTGAKGLNLAASDIYFLSRALIAYFGSGAEDGLVSYSQKALARIWKAERFSWWMTRLLHDFSEEGPFVGKIQRAELDYLFSSRAALTSLAENYVGLPFE